MIQKLYHRAPVGQRRRIEIAPHIPQGGARPSCVIVSFSAEAFAAANETMFVRALLDANSDACQPSNNVFVISNASPTGEASRTTNFLCPDVAPGRHANNIQ